jgi:hypothetical protein
MISREEFKKQVKARRIAKEARAKFGRLQQIANEFPKEVSAALGELSEGFHQVGEALNAMNENLGLVTPPKSASLAIRIAASKNYGAALKKIADESPEELAGAVNEVYSALNELAGDIENFADNTGIELLPPVETETPAEEAAEGHSTLEGPQFVEEELEEAQEAVAEGDMEEAVQESHDAEEAAEGTIAEESVTANAPGAGAWVTDRDETGQPKTPVKASLLRHPK